MNAIDPRPQPVRLPKDWSPASWRGRTALQQPTYPDKAALDTALAELGRLPPLVTSWEILALKRQLAEAQGQALPAAGRRLRRALRGLPSEAIPTS